MRFGLVAGEASGDLLGAGLIRAIRKQLPDATFEGIAGPEMLSAGCDQWEDSDALAVFGLIEPLAHIPRLLKLRRSLVERWRESPPDVFVGIDAPDFNLGLEKALRKAGIRTVHYVSPSIWVWRAGRIKTIREAADRVLCILPFEKLLYEDQGVDAVFVGHPKADSLQCVSDTSPMRDALGLEPGLLVAVLPGSRAGEVQRLGPLLAAAAAQLVRRHENLRFVAAIASLKLRPMFEAQLADAGVAERFTLIDGRSIDVMSAADVVLLASGTAALESALLGKPTVAAYQIAKLSGVILRAFRLLKNDYFTIPNLLTEKPLIPEFIQEDVTPEAMAEAVSGLLENPARRGEIARRFATLRTELALGADDRSADAVISLANSTN
jgi:lipid-A-disaccharide synthase